MVPCSIMIKIDPCLRGSAPQAIRWKTPCHRSDRHAPILHHPDKLPDQESDEANDDKYEGDEPPSRGSTRRRNGKIIHVSAVIWPEEAVRKGITASI